VLSEIFFLKLEAARRSAAEEALTPNARFVPLASSIVPSVDIMDSAVDEISVFAEDASDEELEIAAGATQVTLAACTNVWSTFCNS
jgi:hypothetical protein